jgi:glycine/D-amino acid oxidase-like deaminating enzyme
MSTVTAVVVGAGHCGLAMSRHLAARSIDHVVLERGEVANSWRTQRWDSLRLLTPNWMTRPWATGVRPDFSWLDIPVFDHRGRLLHDGGVTCWLGLYVLGLPMLRRRRSTYIDGACADADDLAAHLIDHLGAGKILMTEAS